MNIFEIKAKQLFSSAGITVNGKEPHDIQVHDKSFYPRFLAGGRMALGEGYMNGEWDCERIDLLILKIFTAKKLIAKHIHTPSTIVTSLGGKVMHYGSKLRSKHIGDFHYDLGNELYEKMLDPTMNYTCALWKKETNTLEEAQINKMQRICEKLQLEPGMEVLDIGCGWGGFARFAAEKYGAHVTGISVSKEQLLYAEEFCTGLPVKFEYLDYRDIKKSYDRIVSVGMFEHVGIKYYRTFMKKVSESLNDKGLFLLHTLGYSNSNYKNPCLTKYIFPGGFIPSIKHIGESYEDLFVLEHVENLGLSYSKTMACWFENFDRNWEEIRKTDPQKYNDRFYRMWKYYLVSTQAGFVARDAQVFQFVFSKNWINQQFFVDFK